MLAAHFNNSLTSLGGNMGGGPYPTAPSGPLQLPSDELAQMALIRSPSVSPKPRSPRYSGHSQGPPNHLTPHPPRSRSQHRRPSPPSHGSHGPSPPHGPPPQMAGRPIPNPATAFPSFTAGRSFASETQLQNIINWQTVTSRNLFEDPPTYQSLLIFLLPTLPSPTVNNFIKQILNTPDHVTHLIKCWDLLKRDDREELVSFGMPEKVGDIRFDIYRMWLMVRLAWRIVQALKNAKGGTRIAECGVWVMHVIETNKTVSPEKFDPIPLQTLACALTHPHPSMNLNSKIKDTVTPLHRHDRDLMAIEYFENGFPQHDAAALFLPSSVYAKAHQARLYRRLELIEEASEAEQAIREWWTRTGCNMMSKARFTDLVCADGEVPSDNIVLKNVEGFFERRSENGSAAGEEVDSSSGRDSGVDVGPIPELKDEKQVPVPVPTTRDQPRLQQQRSIPSMRPLKSYTPQMQYPPVPAQSAPVPPPKQGYPPRAPLGAYNAQSLPSRSGNRSGNPYPSQMYNYTSSSDSLDSELAGKLKPRGSIGAKFGFRRKS